MKLADTLCTPQQANILRKIGIEQKAQWYHVTNGDIITFTLRPSSMVGAAFGPDELANMIPDYKPALGNLEIGKCHTDHITLKEITPGWWNVSYWTWSGKSRRGVYIPERVSYHLQQAPTLSQALAMMVIYLLKNGFITPAEINERINRAE